MFTPTTRKIGRAVLGVLGLAGSAYAALFLAFVGLVITTGCFISCDDPRPLVGLPMIVGAAAVLGAGAAGAFWGFGVTGRRTLLRVFGTVGAVALGLAMALLAFAG